MPPWGFVAVHAGAGQHARSNEKAYQKGRPSPSSAWRFVALATCLRSRAHSSFSTALSEACKAAAFVLQQPGRDLLDAVAAALCVLEVTLLRCSRIEVFFNGRPKQLRMITKIALIDPCDLINPAKGANFYLLNSLLYLTA